MVQEVAPADVDFKAEFPGTQSPSRAPGRSSDIEMPSDSVHARVRRLQAVDPRVDPPRPPASLSPGTFDRFNRGWSSIDAPRSRTVAGVRSSRTSEPIPPKWPDDTARMFPFRTGLGGWSVPEASKLGDSCSGDIANPTVDIM
jgi:hypothetical protein